MIHQLKLQKSFFEDKLKGLKPWELRVNDRDFKIGDYLGENEVIEDDSGEWHETGRFVLEKITSIVDHNDCAGLHVGWVILTCEPCVVAARSESCMWLERQKEVYKVYGEDRMIK